MNSQIIGYITTETSSKRNWRFGGWRWQRTMATLLCARSVYTEAAVLSEIARAQILQAEICELQHYSVLDVCKILSQYHWIFVVSFGRIIILNKNICFTVKSWGFTARARWCLNRLKLQVSLSVYANVITQCYSLDCIMTHCFRELKCIFN